MNKIGKIWIGILAVIVIFMVSIIGLNIQKSIDEMEEDIFTVVAHRGASGHAPEHTIKAYDKGISLGADYIEIDLQMTKDGYLIAMHDKTVDRTTDGTGNISDMTLSEIKQLDAGEEEKVPTLDEVITKYKYTTNYYIETKRPFNVEMDDELIRVLKKHNLFGKDSYEDKVIIQSFSEESLKNIRRQNNTIRIVQLVDNPDDLDLVEVKIYAQGIGCNFTDLTKEKVDNIHSHGLVVHPYTVNTKTDIENMRNIGVDGVFSNYPDRVVELLHNKY